MDTLFNTCSTVKDVIYEDANMLAAALIEVGANTSGLEDTHFQRIPPPPLTWHSVSRLLSQTPQAQPFVKLKKNLSSHRSPSAANLPICGGSQILKVTTLRT